MSDFNGRPINGDISRFTSPPPPQANPQELLNALDALLDVPGVEAVRWDQYTPSWNDGEACNFGVRSAAVKIYGVAEEDVEDTEYGDGWYTEYDLFEYDRSSGSYNRVYPNVGGFDAEVICNALSTFESLLDGGSHDVVLSEKFGDPARVVATKDGFEVEYTEASY